MGIRGGHCVNHVRTARLKGDVRTLLTAGALVHSGFSGPCFYYDLSSSGTLPPFSASFCMTCLCSQMFIDAESFMSPL